MAQLKTIVRYMDGRILKGYTQDFYPDKPIFHLQLVDVNLGGEVVEIDLQELKAVFFVRDFAGKPEYREQKVSVGERRRTGRMVEVTFNDGEVLVGSTLSYDSKRPGFFLYPADPQSNNLSVFVISKEVRQVRFL